MQVLNAITRRSSSQAACSTSRISTLRVCTFLLNPLAPLTSSQPAYLSTWL